MLVTVPRLSRLPSLKDMARAANINDEIVPFGLIGYPVLQAADILLPRAHLVPVGKDNEAHVEITREIARRFNRSYEKEVFPLPSLACILLPKSSVVLVIILLIQHYIPSLKPNSRQRSKYNVNPPNYIVTPANCCWK